MFDQREFSGRRRSTVGDPDVAFLGRRVAEVGVSITALLCKLCLSREHDPFIHPLMGPCKDRVARERFAQAQERVESGGCEDMPEASPLVLPALRFRICCNFHQTERIVVFGACDALLVARGVGNQHPCFWGLVLEAQEHLFLESRRAGDDIVPLASNPLNAEDGPRWQEAENIFEDLGRFQGRTAWHVFCRRASDAVRDWLRVRVREGLELLLFLLALIARK